MSTRCLIGYVKEDGTIESIYCHHDGYLEGVGKILKEHYGDLETIKKLMTLGDLSSLGETPASHQELWDEDIIINQPERWEEWSRKYCCAYFDRGEDWEDIKPRTFESKEEYLNAMGDCWGEYAYLFRNGVWEELVTGKKLIPNVATEAEEDKLKQEMLELAGRLFAEKMYFAKLCYSPVEKGVIDNDTCQEIVETILNEIVKRYQVTKK